MNPDRLNPGSGEFTGGIIMYGVNDVSNNTDKRVMGVRSFARVGFVLHTSSGVDSLGWLQGGSANSGRPASSDYLIARSGTIYKLIPSGHYAYHSGNSSVHGSTDNGSYINQAYIGIEHENDDEHGQNVTDYQYQACAQIIRREAQINGMSPIQLFTHANIALPFGRRSDPVRYDIGRLFYYCANPTSAML